MAQENTPNTDPNGHADDKSGDYPALRRLNRIGTKIELGMGLLLDLFVVAALVSFFQARIVDGGVREITEVKKPTSADAFEVEINVIGIGLGGLKYLQTGDEIHRLRVAKDGAGFEGFKAKYDLLAETPRGRELGNRAGILYPEYKALGDSLMDQAAASLASSTSKADNLVEWRSEIIRGGRGGWQPASHFDVTTVV